MRNLLKVPEVIAKPGKKIKVSDFDPSYTGKLSGKDDGIDKLQENVEQLIDLQARLYADNRSAVLLIFQAMDAAGKDGTIKHVMSGLNPQGCEVYSFKAPSANELDHNYMWRTNRCMPERGRFGIFNRSYYEEVLVVKVHPEYLLPQNIPGVHSVDDVNEAFWNKRYEQINNMEKYLVENGTLVIKFFLNVSKKEQKKRFLDRVDETYPDTETASVIKIYSIRGQLIMQKYIHGNVDNTVIDVAHLPSGEYLLQYEPSNGQSACEKIIIR